MKCGRAAFALVLLLAQPAAAQYADVSGGLAICANALGARRILPPLWGRSLAPAAVVERYEAAWMLAALMDPHDHPFAVTFWSDVVPGHWALQAINQVVGFGILRPEGDRFDGDRPVQRGEFATAVDQLLSYRAIPPPTPRIAPLTFPDVHGELQGVVDRIANRWQLIDPAPRFRPLDLLTRQAAVEMLVRAAPLVDPSFAALLPPVPLSPAPTAAPLLVTQTTPTFSALPTPLPAASPGTTTMPSGPSSGWMAVQSTALPTTAVIATASPSTAAVPLATPDLAATGSASNPPDASFSLGPIAWRWELAPMIAALGFSDDKGPFSSPSVVGPDGADAALLATLGPLCGSGRLTFRAFSGTTAAGTAQSLYQFASDAAGLWLLPLGSGLYGGLGADLALNVQGGSGTSSTASRTFLGAGPAAFLRTMLGPAELDAGIGVPIGAAVASTTTAGFGFSYQLDGRYPIASGSLDALAGLRGQLISPGGGFDFIGGIVLGVGGGF